MRLLVSRLCAIAASCLLVVSCGYVGDPMPPLLHIPKVAPDVAVIEQGEHLVVTFTMPAETTESTPVRRLERAEVRVGSGGGNPFNTDAWADSAQTFPVAPDLVTPGSKVRLTLPAAGFAGREVAVGAKVWGETGREAGWSNLVTIAVVPPLAPPAAVKAEGSPQGVKLTWQGTAPEYGILRGDGEKAPEPLAVAAAREWTDTAAEYGKRYVYQVVARDQTGSTRAESLPSAEVSITPVDKFAPAVPSGLKVVAGQDSIQLLWDAVPDGDLAGYRVYRALGDANPELLADHIQAAGYGDRQVTSGTSYRYFVTSVDRAGNESARSEPVSVQAP